MRLRRAPVLKGAAVAGLLLLGASLAPAAEARMRCSYSGPPQNLLTVTADREALGEIMRRGEEIVVRESGRRPTRCQGGVPTVLNTDTVRVFVRGVLTFVDVLLEGGPFAPGATPENDGTSEIEVEFRGDEPFVTVVGTSRADEFHWNLGGVPPALNLNPTSAGDQDVDVAVIEAGILGAVLIAVGGAGNDRIIPAPGALFIAAEVWSEGGRGDDFLMAPPRTAGQLAGGMGNDVLSGGRLSDHLDGGAGNDRVAAAGGSDLVRGGRGGDLILAGPGGDIINSRDSHRDRVRCGAGRDRVRADRRDRLRGCEVIRRPTEDAGIPGRG
jgi:Ca2+-binding RTX toxin-like protein